jgi:hypothetical protein
VAADSFAIEDTPGDGEDISTALTGKFGRVWGLSSIRLTVDTYGHLIPGAMNTAAFERSRWRGRRYA